MCIRDSMKGVVNQIFDAFIPLEEDAPKGALFLEYYQRIMVPLPVQAQPVGVEIITSHDTSFTLLSGSRHLHTCLLYTSRCV